MKLRSVWLVGLLSVLAWSCAQKISGPKGADGSFDLGEYDVAIAAYEKMLEENPNDPRVNYQIAESFRLSNRIKQASGFYETAFENGFVSDSGRYYYAFALKAQEQYVEARETLDALAADTENTSLANLARKEIENIDQVQSMSGESYYEISAAGPINTAAAEYSPMVSNGEIYFTSNRNDTKIYKTTGTPFTDIYKAKLTGDEIDGNSVEILGDLINLPGINEGTITFTRDGNTVVFARGNDGSKKGTKEVNLYISRYRNGDWSEPELLTVNDPNSWDSSPAFNRNGRTLYFASNRPGGMGGVDLYAATLDGNGRFSNARNLGSDINTAGNDMFPYVDDDGRLFFASNGHPGYGGLDLLVAIRKDGKTTIQNLGSPMNSSEDDFGLIYYSRTKGYFTSNRDGGQGDDDIYAFVDNSPDRKLVNYILAGRTLTPDSATQTNVVLSQARVRLMDTEDNILAETTSDDNGAFEFQLDGETDYLLIGEKPDYFTTRKNFSTIGESIPAEQLVDEITTKNFQTELVMDRIILEKAIVVENIYYDFDSANIRADAAIELNKLARFLQDNPEIKIELGSHTDSRGNDEYNRDLSQRRAESAVNYIISQGVDKNRIRARGYGEARPIAPNTNPDGTDNPEGRQKNRRTEIKVFEYNKDTGRMEEIEEMRSQPESEFDDL
jgi:outer membrane protein OmpA-like peptidoglycan-associated protein/tetratricopeptide (TPR) repeat protein